MKLLPLLTFTIIMCAGCQVTQTYNINTPPEGAQSGSAGDIEKLVDTYVDAFIDKNYSKIDEITEVPFVFVNNDETLSYSTKESLIERYKGIRESLDNSDYSHSEVTSIDISPINDSIAKARIAYSRKDKSGEVFHKGQGVYLFRKKSNQWFLVGRIESSRSETLD